MVVTLKKALSGNAALKAQWKRVKTPLDALRTLAENRDFIGSDPYYRDMDTALWAMVDRVLDSEED